MIIKIAEAIAINARRFCQWKGFPRSKIRLIVRVRMAVMDWVRMRAMRLRKTMVKIPRLEKNLEIKCLISAVPPVALRSGSVG